MTKEESLAWVKSLKPGDIVIYSGFGVAGRIQTAKVEKVTPSGIVRTNRGSFKESPWSWSGRVGGYGKTPYYILFFSAFVCLRRQTEQDAIRGAVCRAKVTFAAVLVSAITTPVPAGSTFSVQFSIEPAGGM